MRRKFSETNERAPGVLLLRTTSVPRLFWMLDSDWTGKNYLCIQSEASIYRAAFVIFLCEGFNLKTRLRAVDRRTQTTELTDASIDGESKRRATFPQTKNIVFALERPKAANSVREWEARVPAGVHAPHGRPLSVMIPIIKAVDVPTSGWMIQSSGAYSPGFNMCRVCFRETEGSSKCQKNRQSCSGWTTVDHLAFTEPFRDDTEATPTTEVGVVSIVGTWTVNIQQMRERIKGTEKASPIHTLFHR